MDLLGTVIMFILHIFIICTIFYLMLKKRYQYWADRGVPQSKPEFVYGNVREVSDKFHLVEKLHAIYHELKGEHPFVGLYVYFKPVALITALELVKCVLVKDFQYFHDRGTYYNGRGDPLSVHLFNVQGLKWQSLRHEIAPAFTADKIRVMLPTFVASANQLMDYMRKIVQGQVEIEINDLLVRYSVDVIGMCAFGIECNNMHEPNAMFRLTRKNIFYQRSELEKLIVHSFPQLAKCIRVRTIEKDVSDFFTDIVRDTIEYREENSIKRDDFLDILMRMRSDKDRPSDDAEIKFNEIASQAFMVFVAAFKTSSSLMSFALYELALHQGLQNKARRCVREAIERHDGKLTYEAALEMDFLDRFLKECLRLYPPVSTLHRETTREYLVPGTNTVLKAGTSVMIPVYAIHRDPEHFPDPDRFDPDRFTLEEENKRHPYAWIPFGAGPRMCVGMSFGMMQARIGLAYLLTEFSFKRGTNTLVPMMFDCREHCLSPEGGMWLKIEKVQ